VLTINSHDVTPKFCPIQNMVSKRWDFKLSVVRSSFWVFTFFFYTIVHCGNVFYFMLTFLLLHFIMSIRKRMLRRWWFSNILGIMWNQSHPATLFLITSRGKSLRRHWWIFFWQKQYFCRYDSFLMQTWLWSPTRLLYSLWHECLKCGDGIKA